MLKQTTVDAAYQLLACRYMGGQVAALRRQVRGARRARDIEYVHQARVASRRLRAAMRMFADCFPARKFSTWRRQIRRLTRRLGAARDTDVQIEYLKGFIAGLPRKSKKPRPGLRRIMLRLKQRRQAIQPKVVKALDRLEEKQVLPGIMAELKAIAARCEGDSPDIRSRYVFQQVQQHICERMDGLRAYEHSLKDSRDIKGHHRLRIAAKRLRYTLEISNLPFENALAGHIEEAKSLQSVLGKLHDCDVWLEDLTTFRQEERSKTIDYLGSQRAFKRLKKGIDYLAGQRRKDRRELFEQSVDCWKQLTESDFEGRLNGLLRKYCGPPQPPGASKEGGQCKPIA